MKASVIQQILKQYGKAEQKGAELHISAGMEAHLIVAVGSEAITVQKVTSLEIHDEFVVASTFKGEKFFFGHEDVTGLKLERIDEKKSDRGAGFGAR